MHFILHIAGIDNAAGQWYCWWSGIGSDLGYVAIVATLLRKHQCEVAPCYRIARHITDGKHKVCKKHMPGGAPSAQHVLDAHEAAQVSDQG